MKYPDLIIENNTHGPHSRSLLIKTAARSLPEVEPPVVISCENASGWLNFSSKQLNYNGTGSDLNHLTLVYQVIVNDIDYGILDLAGNGFMEVGRLGLSVAMGSDGNGFISASSLTGIGNEQFKVRLVSQTNLTDANIWGIDTLSNPTAVYNGKTRSVSVCFLTGSNV